MRRFSFVGLIVWASIVGSCWYVEAQDPVRVGSFEQFRRAAVKAPDFVEGQIRALASVAADGVVCVTDEGFYSYRRGGWSKLPVTEGKTVLAICEESPESCYVLEARSLKRLFQSKLVEVASFAEFEATCFGVEKSRRVWIGSRGGLWLWNGRELRLESRLPEAFDGGRPHVRHVAAAPSGTVAVATSSQIAYREPRGNWTMLAPTDGERSWALRDIRAIELDRDGRLWSASPQGVATFDGKNWKLFDGGDGLPYADFTSIAIGEPSSVWFGTRRGLVRFDGENWEYRHGRRWLPGDSVLDIAVGRFGTPVFVATDSGLGCLSPNSMSLREKAEFFESEIDKRHRRTPYGFVLGVSLGKPGELSTARQHDSDNDGLWTAMYGAGECFAYGATKDPKVKERAKAAFEALKFLGDVTQGGEHSPPPGFPARTILPTSGPDPNEGRIERDRQFKATRDRAWKIIDPRWPKSADGKWYWKCDTSSDELDGHYFFYAQYYDLVADSDAERARVRAVVRRLTDHLIKHDFNLVDHDGEPTRWGHFSPKDLNFNKQWWEERGLNSMSMLSYLKVAEHVTGDEKYRRVARELIDQHGYAINVLYPKSQIGVSSGNQSDDEMAFMGFYNLLKYENDPELRSIYAFAFQRYWRLEFPERNPLFHFLFAGVVREDEWKDPWGTTKLGPNGEWLEDSIDTLKRFPLDLVNWRMENSHRLDIVRLPKHLRPGTVSPRGVRHDGKVLRIDERYVEHWNHDPFVLDTGGSGARLADGASFLLPYYLGLYHGFLR